MDDLKKYAFEQLITEVRATANELDARTDLEPDAVHHARAWSDALVRLDDLKVLGAAVRHEHICRLAESVGEVRRAASRHGIAAAMPGSAKVLEAIAALPGDPTTAGAAR